MEVPDPFSHTTSTIPSGTSTFTEQDLHELKSLHYNKKRGIYLGRFEDQYRTGAVDSGGWGLEDPASRLIELHKRYLSYCGSRRIILRRGPNEERDFTEYKSKHYVVRGSAEYKKRQMGRCQDIIQRWRTLGLPKGTTIRVSTRQVGSIWKHFMTMKQEWPLFMNWMRMTYSTIYVWSCEPTKKGYLHFHIVCPKALKPGSTAQAILGWWKARGHDIEQGGVEVQPVRGEAVGYIMKYVTKQCNDQRWNGILWLSGRRSLGVSRALSSGLAQAPSAPEQINSQWELLGIVPTALEEWILTDRPPPEDIKDILRQLSPGQIHRDGLGKRAKRFM